MIKRILFAALLLFTVDCRAQIYLNPGVDTSFVEVRSALKFFNNYISDFKGKKIPDMKLYWKQSELAQRQVPDQIIYAQGDFPIYSQGYTPTIIYVRPTKNQVHIKLQLSMINDGKNISTAVIANYYIDLSDKKPPSFINPMTVNLSSWRMTTKRNIKFYYPRYHKFNAIKADSLLNAVEKLEKIWGLQPINIRYYMADDPNELYKLRGLDYALLMGNKLKPSGISDDKDNQVFCGGLGENYFHEVAHLYLNRLYLKSPLQEGLVVFYAGSMGRNVNWHLKRVNTYLSKHPDADLSDVDNFWYTDPYTNPGSAIQGLICKLVFEKGGLTGLKRLMSHTNYKDIFEKEFNVSSKEINSFLKIKIKEQADL